MRRRGPTWSWFPLGLELLQRLAQCTDVEHRAFFALAAEQWRESGLPGEAERCVAIAGGRELTRAWLDAWFPVQPDGRRRNPGLAEEHERASAVGAARRKVAQQRWQQESANADTIASGHPIAPAIAPTKPPRTNAIAPAIAPANAIAPTQVKDSKSTGTTQHSGISNEIPGAEPRAATAPPPTDPHPTDPVSDGQLLAFERSVLWLPDRKPPDDWSEGRSVSIYRALRDRGLTGGRIMTALEGLDLLRQRGTVAWLHRGDKVTARALYNSATGVLDLFQLAEDTASKHTTPTTRRRGLQLLGTVMATLSPKEPARV